MTASRVDEILKQIARLSDQERRDLLSHLQADQLRLPLSDQSQSFQANTLVGDPDWTVLFDGGSIGNPGKGYGSYAIYAPRKKKPEIQRLEFGDGMTNNEAEYATLMQALDDLQGRIERSEHLPQEFSIEIRGDSLLVINQLSGEWKSKDDRMRSLRDAVRKQIMRFKSNRLVQHPREESVRVLGH